MTKPTILLCALLGLFCAQIFVMPATCAPDGDIQYEDDNNDHGNTNHDGEEDDVEDPAEDLNCILFGTSACHATCATIAYLYGTTGSGTCKSDQSCKCVIEMETDLKSMWNERIENDIASGRTLTEIEADPDLSSIAVEILQQFPRTNAQLLYDLKQEFSADIRDINKIKSKKDNSPITKYVTDEDDVNETGLRKHLFNFIQQSLRSKKFTIADPNYQPKLIDFLKKNSGDEELKSYIQDHVRQSNNAALNKLIENGNVDGKYSFEFDDSPTYELMPDFVAAAVNDEFAKFADAAANPPPRPRRPARLPSRKTVAGAKLAGRTPTPRPLPSTAEKTPQRSQKATATPSASSSQPDDVQRWNTPNEILDDARKFGSVGSNEWEEDGTYVKIVKDMMGDWKLWWEKGTDKFYFHKDMNGGIDQTWKFGNVTVNLSHDMMGTVKERWNFGQTLMSHTRDFMGNSSINWKDNKRDTKLLQKYKGYVNAWCDKNILLFGGRKCKIYISGLP